MIPTLQEALDGLMPPEMERLKHCFDQGTCAFTKVKRYEGLFIGCHMEQLMHMEIIVTEGKWSLARKKQEEA